MTEQNHPQGTVLQAYFDDELTKGEAAPVAAHIADCAECRQVLTELATVQAVLAGEAPMAAPGPVWPGVLAELNQKKSQRFGPMFACGTAAACAAGIVLGIFVGASEDRDLQDSLDGTGITADYVWSAFENTSILDVYTNTETTEGTEGS